MDLIISCHPADAQTGSWIEQQLLSERYQVELQVTSSVGEALVAELVHLRDRTSMLMPLLSPDYIRLMSTGDRTWTRSFSHDPDARRGLVLPVRIADCDVTPLHAGLRYLDLYGVGDNQRKRLLSHRVRQYRLMAGLGVLPPGGRPRPISCGFACQGLDMSRWSMLQVLDGKLRSGGDRPQIVAITGMAGAGKSRLAMQLACYMCGHYGPYDYVLRLRAGSPAALAQDYASLSQTVGLPLRDPTDQQAVIRSVREWLEERDRWLLIFDGARHPADLEPYLPRPREGIGHVVITSRNTEWPGALNPIPLRPFRKSRGASFLARRLYPGLQPDAPTPKGLDALSHELGGLTWALEASAQYIHASHIPVGGYLSSLRDKPGEVLRHGQTYAGSPSTPLEFHQIVQRLQRDSPAAVQVLSLCACLLPRPIQVAHLRQGVQHLLKKVQARPPGTITFEDTVAFDQGLATLIHEGLVEMWSQWVRPNKLYASLVREAWSESEKKAWFECAAWVVLGPMPTHLSQVRRWADWGCLIAHARYLLKQMSRLKMEDAQSRGELFHRVGFYYLGIGRYRLAKCALRSAYTIYRRAKNVEYGTQIRIRVDLGDLSYALADWRGALSHYRAALNMERRFSGAHHWYMRPYSWQTAAIQTRLGRVYRCLNNFAKADSHCRRAAVHSEKPVPPPWPSWKTWKEIVRRFLTASGFLRNRIRAIRPYFRSDFRPDHVEAGNILRHRAHVLLDLDHLTTTLLAMKELELAGKRDQTRYGAGPHLFIARSKAAEGRLRQVMAESPDTGLTFQDIEQHYQKAEAAYREALAMDERLLGRDHPTVAADLHDLAAILVALVVRMPEAAWASDEALDSIEAALEIDKRACRFVEDPTRRPPGARYPAVARDMVTLGQVSLARGDVASARTTLQQAEKLMAEAYGASHRWMATVWGALGDAAGVEEDWQQAADYYEKAWLSDARNYGPAHRRARQSQARFELARQHLP